MREVVGTPLPVRAKLRKRLRPLFIAVFLQNFIFWYAIEKLFMKSIGFSDINIALATIVFTAVTLVVNIPLGLLADKWSRKGVLMVASLFLALSSLVCGLSSQPIAYTVGLGLWGVFLGCYSGTYESIVYDTVVEETKSPELFTFYYGRVALYSTAALIASALASGIIGEVISLRMDYFVSVPLALATIIPLHYFSEPTLHKLGGSQQMVSRIKEILQYLKRRETIWIALALMLVGVALRLTLEFGPLWLVALALPIVLYGPAIALMQSSIGISGILAHRVKHKSFYISVIAMVTLLFSLSLTTRILPLIIISLSLLVLGLMLLTITLNRYLHEAIPSNIRVGTMSFVSTIGYIVFLPIAGLFGFISDRLSIFSAAWLIIVITGLIFVIVLNLVHSSPKISMTLLKSTSN